MVLSILQNQLQNKIGRVLYAEHGGSPANVYRPTACSQRIRRQLKNPIKAVHTQSCRDGDTSILFLVPVLQVHAGNHEHHP